MWAWRSTERARAPVVGVARRRAGLGAVWPWEAADGWLPAGLVLAVGGGTAAVLEAWHRVASTSAPATARLMPLALVLALAGLAGAQWLVRLPGERRTFWRWLAVALALGGGLGSDPGGLRTRFWVGWFAAAGLLALAIRAGETLGAALCGPRLAVAPVPPTPPRMQVSTVELLERSIGSEGLFYEGMKAGGAVPVRAEPPPPERVAEQDALGTSWRLVAEYWLLAALAAPLGAGAAPYRLAAAAAAFGGALLVTGCNLAMLRASWARRRFVVEQAHIRLHWGLGTAFAAALTLAAVLAPLPSNPLAGARIPRLLPTLGQMHLPTWGSGGGTPASGMSADLLIGPAAVVMSLGQVLALLRAALLDSFLGEILALMPGLPLTLTLLLVLVGLGVLVLRYPGRMRPLMLRLLRLLRELVLFWRWIRWPRRLRFALARRRRAPEARAPEAARLPLLGWSARLWSLVDPRAAVRVAYRQFLRRMAAEGHPRGAHQSPQSYQRALLARRVVAPELDSLTAAYELARFSDHPPERAWVTMARRGLAAAVRLMRGARRRARRARARAVARRLSGGR